MLSRVSPVLILLVLVPATALGNDCQRTELERAIRTYTIELETDSQVRKAFPKDRGFILQAPNTTPTSGAEVFILSAATRAEPLAAVKVFPSNSSDASHEIAASTLLEGLALENSTPPRVIHQMRTKRGETLVISTYGGTDVDHLVARSAAGDGDPLYQASIGVAKALAEVHAKGRHLLSNAQPVLEYQNYEVTRLSGISAMLEPDQPLGQALLASHTATRNQLSHLRAIFDAAATDFARKPIRSPSVIHGDAHPGNFGYRAMARPKITIFDAPAMAGFADGHGDPMADFGRFTGGILVAALEHGMPITRAEQIQTIFSRQYWLEAGIPQGGSSEAIRFHQLRFYAVVLEEGLRSQQKISAPARQRLIEYILTNFSQAR